MTRLRGHVAFVAGALSAVLLASTVVHPAGPTSGSGRTLTADCPVTPLPDTSGLPYRTDPGARQHVDCAQSDGAPLHFDELDDPPMASRAADRSVDVVAHFYNDFGLDKTRRGAGGWIGWYDWQWNATDNTGDGISAVGHDPAREPLLGNYAGDDPRVLGWIAYWLASSGVQAVNLVDPGGFTTASFGGAAPDWREQWFDRTPNSAALDYVLAIGSSGGRAQIERRADELVRFYDEQPGAYSHERAEGTFAVVSTWDLEGVRGAFDAFNGHTKTDAFLVELAGRFKAIGYDGVTVLARNGGLTARDAPDLLAKGVDVQFSTYEGLYSTTPKATTVEEYLERVDYSTAARFPNTTLGVFTSLESAYPHPSGYRISGATPARFRRQLEAAAAAAAQQGLPQMITVNNVSEWAEAGPGLIPNMQDGFGYLEAIRTAEFPG